MLPLLLSYGNVFDVSANAQTITDVEPCYIPHVSINVDYVVLTPGASTSVSATCTPSSGTIEWSSDDPSIATVSETGTTAIVRAKTSGVVMINAYSGSLIDSIPVYVSDTNLSGLNYIYNKQTSRVVDIEGPSKAAGATIQQWSNGNVMQQEWVIEYKGSGYYTIQSLYSGLYIGVESASSGAAVKQYSSWNSNNTKWVITKTSSGYYRFTSFSCLAAGYSLSVESGGSANGVDLFVYAYTDNSDARDEWYFSSVDYTWNADNNIVGVWQETPKIYIECESSDSAFISRVDNAISIWSSALDISILKVSNADDANIKIYYGTWDYLEDSGCLYRREEEESGILGVTTRTKSINPIATVSIYGEEKKIYSLISANVYITTDPFIYDDDTKNPMDLSDAEKSATVIHELGHALGYYGHSDAAGKIMYPQIFYFTDTSLTINEIYHLKLVYDKHH